MLILISQICLLNIDFIRIPMKSPTQSPKNHKSVNKKQDFSQQIKPKPVNQLTSATVSPPKTVEKPPSSPDRKRYMMETGSVRNDDVGKEIQDSQKDLKAKNQKICNCINLFNLMQSNNMQLRCAQHNNVLTLYCLTERKILCVNCNYGDFKHKTHKIVPLKDSNSYINQDNLLLRETLNRDLKIIEQSIKHCQQNSIIFEKEMKNCLNAIQKQFMLKMSELKAKYEQQVQRLRRKFLFVINKSSSLEKDIEQFKFRIWETISKIGIGKRNESVSNETQIIRHVLCSNMVEFTKFELRKMGKKDIERLVHKSKYS